MYYYWEARLLTNKLRSYWNTCDTCTAMFLQTTKKHEI